MLKAERYRSRQSSAATPLTLSSQTGAHHAVCFHAARSGRGFSFRPARAAERHPALWVPGWPGAPSPGTTSISCSMPRVHGATLRQRAAREYVNSGGVCT